MQVSIDTGEQRNRYMYPEEYLRCISYLVPTASYPNLLSRSRALFLHGCEIKAGAGRTGSEANHFSLQPRLHSTSNPDSNPDQL